jgi:RNA polymerase sigma-70 factor (ECF subfamily)
VRLIDLEGLDYQDAAKILDLPLGTVKSRLTRARLKMRDMFQQSRWL